MSSRLKIPDDLINRGQFISIHFIFALQVEENDAFSEYGDEDGAVLSDIGGTSPNLAMDGEDTDHEMV